MAAPAGADPAASGVTGQCSPVELWSQGETVGAMEPTSPRGDVNAGGRTDN